MLTPPRWLMQETVHIHMHTHTHFTVHTQTGQHTHTHTYMHKEMSAAIMHEAQGFSEWPYARRIVREREKQTVLPERKKRINHWSSATKSQVKRQRPHPPTHKQITWALETDTNLKFPTWQPRAVVDTELLHLTLHEEDIITRCFTKIKLRYQE